MITTTLSRGEGYGYYRVHFKKKGTVGDTRSTKYAAGGYLEATKKFFEEHDCNVWEVITVTQA